MKDIIFDDFQNSIEDSLLRHKSILDILSKYQDSQARISRAICKAVTNCGCIEINASKQNLNDLDDLKGTLSNHLEGKLCDNCREIIEQELGNNIFYLTSLCATLDLNIFDIILKEYEKVKTFGKFNFR
ncbi:MAG: DUF1573 domain-containing protein [Sarcina sp.]